MEDSFWCRYFTVIITLYKMVLVYTLDTVSTSTGKSKSHLYSEFLVKRKFF